LTDDRTGAVLRELVAKLLGASGSRDHPVASCKCCIGEGAPKSSAGTGDQPSARAGDVDCLHSISLSSSYSEHRNSAHQEVATLPSVAVTAHDCGAMIAKCSLMRP
jgi:hypothetical protein